METFFDRQARKVLEFVVSGTRGGPMRLAVLREITRKPRNTNELSKILKIDYKTTEYHLKVLKENGIVMESKAGHGSTFSISPFFRNWEKIHKGMKSNRSGR